MKLLIGIVAALVALSVLWMLLGSLLHFAVGMVFGLVRLALIIGLVIFVVGLVRRLLIRV